LKSRPLGVALPLAALALASVESAWAASPVGHPTEQLIRVHQAASSLSFTGTYVHSHGEGLFTAKIYQQVDRARPTVRIVSVDGEPREVIRSSDAIKTFIPEQKTVRVSPMVPRLADFPALLHGAPEEVLVHYRLKVSPGKRVAGLPTDKIELEPVDAHRYAWRYWVDRKTGLLLKSQQMHPDGRVLAELAFTELKVGKKVTVRSRYEGQPGWTQKLEDRAPMAEQELQGLPTYGGFKPVSGLRSPDGQRRQIFFSDGLARISVFMEADVSQAPHVLAESPGGTSIAAVRHNNWLITAIGEVPLPTAVALAQKVSPDPLP
jgi:sigma-E factor negative regulatory protein RseB